MLLSGLGSGPTVPYLNRIFPPAGADWTYSLTNPETGITKKARYITKEQDPTVVLSHFLVDLDDPPVHIAHSIEADILPHDLGGFSICANLQV